ncbi:hypothetical protein P7C70_g5947, partial [Phenoliferia sp. Uapishka_3]
MSGLDDRNPAGGVRVSTAYSTASTSQLQPSGLADPRDKVSSLARELGAEDSVLHDLYNHLLANDHNRLPDLEYDRRSEKLDASTLLPFIFAGSHTASSPLAMLQKGDYHPPPPFVDNSPTRNRAISAIMKLSGEQHGSRARLGQEPYQCRLNQAEGLLQAFRGHEAETLPAYQILNDVIITTNHYKVKVIRPEDLLHHLLSNPQPTTLLEGADDVSKPILLFGVAEYFVKMLHAISTPDALIKTRKPSYLFLELQGASELSFDNVVVAARRIPSQYLPLGFFSPELRKATLTYPSSWPYRTKANLARTVSGFCETDLKPEEMVATKEAFYLATSDKTRMHVDSVPSPTLKAVFADATSKPLDQLPPIPWTKDGTHPNIPESTYQLSRPLLSDINEAKCSETLSNGKVFSRCGKFVDALGSDTGERIVVVGQVQPSDFELKVDTATFRELTVAKLQASSRHFMLRQNSAKSVYVEASRLKPTRVGFMDFGAFASPLGCDNVIGLSGSMKGILKGPFRAAPHRKLGYGTLAVYHIDCDETISPMGVLAISSDLRTISNALDIVPLTDDIRRSRCGLRRRQDNSDPDRSLLEGLPRPTRPDWSPDKPQTPPRQSVKSLLRGLIQQTVDRDVALAEKLMRSPEVMASFFSATASSILSEHEIGEDFADTVYHEVLVTGIGLFQEKIKKKFTESPRGYDSVGRWPERTPAAQDAAIDLLNDALGLNPKPSPRTKADCASPFNPVYQPYNGSTPSKVLSTAWYDCTNTTTPLEVVDVDPAFGWASINLVNGGANYETIVSIDEHPMWVYAADGSYIEPVEVEAISIPMGERYSVFIKLNKAAGSAFTIRTSANVAPQIMSGYAILHYSANGEDTVFTSPVASTPYIGYGSELLSTTSRLFNATHHPPYPAFAPPLGPADLTIKLHIDRYSPTAYVLNSEPFGLWREVETPPLFSPTETINANLTVPYKSGQIVDLILEPVAGQPSHPIHKHVSQGPLPLVCKGADEKFPVDRASKAGFSDQAQALGEAIHASPGNFNLVNPMYRDNFNTLATTGGVPAWTVVRFVSAEPGPTFIHCHISLHLSSGMAIVLLESMEDIPTIPSQYLKYAYEASGTNFTARA